MRVQRRDLLKAGGALVGSSLLPGLLGCAARALAVGGSGKGGAGDDWDAGALAHLIPAASHERFLVKASFREPLAAPPRLLVGTRAVAGVRGDGPGRFWSFDAPGLAPATRYELSLRDASGRALCEPWPLATFPAPDASPGRFRVLVYTCAGGNDAFSMPDGTPVFLPLALRRRLLRRGLSFAPDAVVAIGDHVYLDQLSGALRFLRQADPELRRRLAERAGRAGVPFALFDRSAPVHGHANEDLLVRSVDPQVAALYGTLLRSVPSTLTLDDHDYFEDDRATDDYVTFPPDPFMLRLARATQGLYYPELLPAPGVPSGLGGVGAGDRAPGVSECFGALRYGRLAELLLYDCRRFLSLAGARAGFVPEETERWLRARLEAGEARYVVNVPSTPVGWSAGKWLEWYPDVLDEAGALGTAREKRLWQSGWFAQHGRLLAAASRHQPVPLFVSGDLHSLGETRIARSGELDLSANPVVSILSGPLGTGPPGWPSGSGNRGVRGTAPRWLEVDERLPCVEQNGFALLDFTPEAARVQLFAWGLGDDPDAIERLEPFHSVHLPRAA